MKSLLITHDFPPRHSGGIAVFYQNLATHLGQKDIQVLAPQCHGWAKFDQQQSYKIHRQPIPTLPPSFLKKRQFWHIFYLIYLFIAQFSLFFIAGNRIIHREKIDIILIGHLYLAPLGWLLYLTTGCPYGIILHGSELSRYWQLGIVRQLFIAWLNHAKFLVVNSYFTQYQYLDRGVNPEHNFILIYPGIDVKRFSTNINSDSIIQRHQIADRPIILTVARLVAWKGQDMVIRALPEIIKVVPDVVYIIVGDGPYRPILEQITLELGLQSHIIFAGFVPDEELSLYYTISNVMVMVGREFRPGMPVEGFGMVYLEANTAQCPVVGSRLGGATEAVVDGVTGILVDPYNKTEIVQAITNLLTDSRLARRLGTQGQARAITQFAWETQTEKLRQQLVHLVQT